MTWFKGFFRPGENPGQFGQNTNGPANQTNNECCSEPGDQLLTCADLLLCPVIQELMALAHPPVTLAPNATAGGMSIGLPQVFSATQSTTLTPGWLSAADWNTFNSKMTDFDITDGSTTQTVTDGQTITFTDSFPILAVVSAPRTITFSLDATGAIAGDVLTFVGPGFAWMAGGGGLTGGGTVDFVPRWSPIGTNLVDSIIQSTATKASIGTAPVATAMFSILTVGAVAKGLNVESNNTQRAATFDSTGTSTRAVSINQSAVVGSAYGLEILNTSAVAGGINRGVSASTSGANVGGTNIGGDFSATGATTNFGVRSEGNIVPFATKLYTLGTAALRWSGLFLGCNIDYNNDLLFDFVGATTMTLTTGGRLGIGAAIPDARLHVIGEGITSATMTLHLQNSGLKNIAQLRDDGQIIIGIDSTATTANDVVVGRSNVGGNTFANYIYGFFNTAISDGGVCLYGFGNTGGKTSIAIGDSNTVTGQECNMAIGQNNTVSLAGLTCSYAIGKLNTITHSFSTIIGDNTSSDESNAFYYGRTVYIFKASQTELLSAAAQVIINGGLNNSPIFRLRAKYDSDPGAGITSANYDFTVQNVMLTGGASPSSRTDFNIDVTSVMSLLSDGSIGIGTTTPNASAKVQIDSTTQGLVAPRMTNAQMLAIGAPISGLQVYDITNNQFMGYNGTLWVILG